MGESLARFVDRFRKIAEAITTAMFFALFAIYLAGVVARYVFNAPIAWADELAMIVFMWCMFLTDAFVSRDKDHVAFDILWERLPPGGRRVVGLLQTGSIRTVRLDELTPAERTAVERLYGPSTTTSSTPTF